MITMWYLYYYFFNLKPRWALWNSAKRNWLFFCWWWWIISCKQKNAVPHFIFQYFYLLFLCKTISKLSDYGCNCILCSDNTIWKASFFPTETVTEKKERAERCAGKRAAVAVLSVEQRGSQRAHCCHSRHQLETLSFLALIIHLKRMRANEKVANRKRTDSLWVVILEGDKAK